MTGEVDRILNYLADAAVPPAGIIKMYAGISAPDGWLFCDGSEVAKADYTALYAVIGNVYGTPSDNNHFKLPDLRGRTPIGSGTGDASDATAHALGQKAGKETHVLSIDEIPSHRHSENIFGASSGGSSSGGYVAWGNKLWVTRPTAGSAQTYRMNMMAKGQWI